ncbi:MAG: hypothetical protein Q7R45_15560, partial [Sulfuricaulis sp.]|nr:hypothetical protein [Sulfuricaulis sp.]
AQVANTVAEVYKEQDYMRSTGPPGERARRQAQQLNELKRKFDQAQQEIAVFRQRNGLIDEGSGTGVDTALLAALEARLLEAQNTRRAAEARISQDPSVNDQVLASSLVQSLKTQLATQESRLAQLNTLYTPEYPEIPELQSQIESTRRSLESALQTYSANATAGLGAAQRLEQSLQRTVLEQRARLLNKGRLHDEAAEYLMALESAQAVYKRALESHDQVMFASGGHQTNVSFVSYATPPVKASKPKILTGLVLGALAAGTLGLGLPLGYELLNRRVRCRDDLERHHGIPVLVEFGPLPAQSPMKAAA